MLKYYPENVSRNIHNIIVNLHLLVSQCRTMKASFHFSRVFCNIDPSEIPLNFS